MVGRALAACALVAAVGTARADRDGSTRVPHEARVLADLGRAFHEAGLYDKAIAAFEHAYVIAPSPGLLFDLAQSYRLSGDCADAAWMYRRYLASDPAPEGRAIAEEHLADVAHCGHADVALEGAPEAAAKPPASPRPRATQPATAAVVATVPPARSRLRETAAWIGVSGGVVLVGAAYFALDAHAASDQVSAAFAHGADGADVARLDARGRRSATLATVLGAGGGLAVVGAAALYVIAGRSAPARHVVLAPHPGGAEVRMSWQF